MVLYGCVPGGSIDVNLLLTQLLAKGLIGQTDSSQSASPPPATVTSNDMADDATATDVCVAGTFSFDETSNLHHLHESTNQLSSHNLLSYSVMVCLQLCC